MAAEAFLTLNDILITLRSVDEIHFTRKIKTSQYYSYVFLKYYLRIESRYIQY